jgi:hypothetical protein
VVKKNRSGPKDPAERSWPRLEIQTHDELVARLPEIFRRLNADAERSRLLFVNPLLVLEDVGVILSDDLEQHVRQTLGFPEGRMRKIAAARKKLRAQLSEAATVGRSLRIPKTPQERATLVFDRLCVPYEGARPETLTVEELRNYRSLHPIVETLYELGRLERGALPYETRAAYAEYKAGRSHHRWLRRLRFHVEE